LCEQYFYELGVHMNSVLKCNKSASVKVLSTYMYNGNRAGATINELGGCLGRWAKGGAKNKIVWFRK